MLPRASGRFAVFVLLCFGWLAAIPLLQRLFGIASLDFGAMARSATEKSGAPWTSSLSSIVRLALEERGLWLLILGSAAPTVAALSVMILNSDRSKWIAFAGRFHPLGLKRLRTLDALGVYAVLVCSILASLVLVFMLREIFEPGRYVVRLSIEPTSLAAAIALAAFLDQGAVLEEPGWRGYATPLLQTTGWSPLTTALVVGAVWGLWHIPRDVATGVVERLGAVSYVAHYLPAFLLGTIAVSIAATFAMNRLGGSIVPADYPKIHASRRRSNAPDAAEHPSRPARRLNSLSQPIRGGHKPWSSSGVLSGPTEAPATPALGPSVHGLPSSPLRSPSSRS